MSSLQPRHPHTLSEFGQGVRERREGIGISQTKCAKGRSFSNTWLAHLEAGRINPKLVSLLDLADALDVSVAALIGDLEIDPRD